MKRRKTSKTPEPVAPAPLAGAAAQIIGNLMVLTDGTVLAGYRLPTERWEFTGEGAKGNLLDRHGEAFSELAIDGGRVYHERVTTKPFPVQQWAARLDSRTPTPLPDVHACEPGMFSEGQMAVGECGCETWNGLLARWQQRIARNGLADKWVFRYFGVGRVKPGKDVRAVILTHAGARMSIRDAEITAVLGEEQRVAEITTAWGATRMTEHQQAWLRQRSVAPGVLLATPPGEGGWDSDSLPHLVSDIAWEEAPFDRAVTVRAWVDGVMVEHAVQVLTVARLDEMAYPSNGLEPWQTFAERAVDTNRVPFEVQWSISGRLHSGDDIAADAERGLRLALNLQRDYRDHSEPPPEYTERGIVAAARIRDEATTGVAVKAARFRGTIDAIVVAAPIMRDGEVIRPAIEVCEERAAALRRLYGAPPLRMEMGLVHPQSIKLRSTIPGEAPERSASQRQVPIPYLAAGLPAAASAVGDDAGPYVGYTRGAARRAVMHDPHFATEGRGHLGRGQNLWVVAGTLGSGKSVLEGLIAYEAARRGETVVIGDPSGPLGALCDLPELARYSRRINLTESPDGSLSPAALVREPTLEEFTGNPTDADYVRAVKRAEAERAALLFDAARRCLSPDLYYDKESTLSILQVATAGKHWTPKSSLWDLVTILKGMKDIHADRVARSLESAASQPLFSLLFTEPGAPPPDLLSNATLTVVSTPGVQRPPDSVDRWDWSTSEAAADVVLRLSAFYTDRLIYNKPRDQRAVVIFDEAESLTDAAAGRGFLSRLGRDHSKWNIGVYLAVKSISEAMMGEEIRNFIAGAFVGRMANEGAAEQMLDILNIPDRRYARTLMRLSEAAPGEFVHLDATGRVAAMRVDVDYQPSLKAALLTDPTPAGAEGWAVRGEML